MPGRLIDVGGFRLHLHCSGSGRPAVVMDSALAGSSISWSLIQPDVSRLTRACSYDRAGFGWSDAGPMPRTAGRVADELRVLLERGGVAPPFVLVGHSFGGLVMRIFAARYRSDVSGLVLVDPAHPEDWVTPAPKEQIRIDRGIKLCRSGATAARFGAARLVSGLVTFGLFGVARGLATVVSRGGLSREDEGVLAPVLEAATRDAQAVAAVLDAREVLRCARQPDRLHLDERSRDARGRRRRLRRPAARHHLLHRSRRLPAAPAGGTRPPVGAAAATSSPRRAGTGFPWTSRRSSSTQSGRCSDATA